MAGPFVDTFAALRHGNFRYWWFGQCISLIGTWMQRAAQIWLVYSMTHSALLLGLLTVFQAGPVLLLSIPAGVYVDRFPKRKIVLVSQIVLTLQAFALAALTWSGRAQYWQILLLALIQGIAMAADAPARQSFFIDLVGKEDLINAISLNSSIMNLAQIVGPSVAGLVMAVLGPSPCFFLNGVSFLAVIYGLCRITVDGLPRNTGRRGGRVWAEAWEGLHHIWDNQALRLTAELSAITSIFTMNGSVLIPVFTDKVLHLGVKQYGLLMSLNGVGALFGALMMASRARRGFGGSVLLWTAIAASGLHVVVAFGHSFLITSLLIPMIGAANMIFSTAANSSLQLGSKDEYRGRVMAFYMMTRQGGSPVGNSLAGAIMEHFGSAAGYFSVGILSLATIGLCLITQRESVRTTLLASPGGSG